MKKIVVISLLLVIATPAILMMLRKSGRNIEQDVYAQCSPIPPGRAELVEQARATLSAAGFAGRGKEEYCVEIEVECDECSKDDIFVKFTPRRGGNWSGAIVSTVSAHDPIIRITQ
ncbi:hypothetical protein ACX40Y_14175 [Sphingomonas sp. RS6]